MDLKYRVVDVFTQNALEGNGLAVFLDGRELDDSTMQRIAREMNQSETVFFLPPTLPDCVARLRIFTPFSEMAFAGHPTVGASYIARAVRMVPKSPPKFSLQENVGAVPIRADKDGSLWLTTPRIGKSKTFPHSLCARALGLNEDDLPTESPCQVYSAGNPFLFVAVGEKKVVDRASPEPVSIALLSGDASFTGIFVFAPTREGAYSRMFAPEQGIWEDPATGSATGPLAAFMMDNRLVAHADGTRFVSEQGTKMGRRSLLHVLIHGDYGKDGIEVGGFVVPVATGTLRL
ncbi:MAG TPA: PhzF family phenazine biosynthesis protein [Candidatus Rubrimentiphilum sp.]|nr:PhzF family phenazine biosynthesis protein [Candidatus Rubrimentiphilum sp.]